MSTVKYFKWKELLQAQNSLGMAPRGSEELSGAFWARLSLLPKTKRKDLAHGPSFWLHLIWVSLLSLVVWGPSK